MAIEKKKVSVIPAQIQFDRKIKAEQRVLRVAAYCRVSTEKEQQQSSFVTQIDYYTEKIGSNPNWTLAGIYADDGKSATSTKKRKDFHELLKDCEKGNIDMVITKSVSRFARNTVDSLTVIRKLKENNIAVFFEKENINTLESTGEILLTILSSQAQEESRNISENVRWGVVRKFENGQILVNHNKFMGYTKDKDGDLVIVPEEAEIVKKIFSLYLEGNSIGQIKKYLEEKNTLTCTGKKSWHATVILKMLKNEKYMGDALLQKTYTVDFLTKKRVINNGIVPQYYVEGSHEGIIPRDLFYRTQEEILRRSGIYKKTQKKNKVEKGKYSSKYALTGILVCGECGQPYQRCTWSKNGKKKVVWRCTNRLRNGTKYCKKSVTLMEEPLNAAIMNAINGVVENQGEFVGAFRQNVIRVIGSYSRDNKDDEFNQKIEQKEKEMLLLIEENAKIGAYTEEFDQAYQEISQQINILKDEKKNMYKQNRMADQYAQRVKEIDTYIDTAKFKAVEYDDELVRQLVQTIKAGCADKVVIQLKSGIIIEQELAL